MLLMWYNLSMLIHVNHSKYSKYIYKQVLVLFGGTFPLHDLYSPQLDTPESPWHSGVFFKFLAKLPSKSISTIVEYLEVKLDNDVKKEEQSKRLLVVSLDM